MSHPDDKLAALNAIISEFAAFCASHGAASETDTRVKVIDRVLREVCGWPEKDISREDHSESGFSDYILTMRSKPALVVEAKREGESFRLPAGRSARTYSLDGVLVTEKPIREAISHVQGYCGDHGIRFAIATNGYAWIVFRAIRDDMPWRKGQARVFPSLESIRDNIVDFLNLLSHEAISAGSLNEEFSPSIRASRQLFRVIDRLFNADLPLQRNRLNTHIQPLIKLLFEDIAAQESLDILQSCYIHTGTLITVANDLNHILTEAIPKFLVDEGTVAIGAPGDRRGFERTFKDAINVTKGELFLLLGAIGSGKSTFLKRFLRTSGARTLDSRTMWFLIDFLQGPVGVAEMEDFVWASVLGEVRDRYAQFECEKRKHLHEVFKPDIEAVEATLLADMKPGSHKYSETLSPLLFKWQSEYQRYVPRLVQVSCKRLNRIPVLIIDNVDQLSPEYQAHIFLLAQRVSRIINCITLVALREESYYAASVQRTFTAYSTRRFHIASPHFRRMIGNRIEYAIRMIDRWLVDGTGPVSAAQLPYIRDFFVIVQQAMVENVKIGRFIKAICHGNMRFALSMFATFVTSGCTDVDKMLRIYRRDGSYNIADHEFIKAIMLGERAYYKEEQSPIANIYSVGSQKNSSHFTAWRILRLLMDHRGESTPMGQGYVELAPLLHQFDDIFNNQEDFIATVNRLVSRNLIEANTRSTESVKGASHVRVTSAGWYFIRYLAISFPYLDLVLQDTPINDPNLEKILRDSVYRVNNMTDAEESKIQRVDARFERVDQFITYLQQEEEAERAHFGLSNLDSPLARPIVAEIRAEFEQEKEWIGRRIRENRERYRDDDYSEISEEEEQLMGIYEVEEPISGDSEPTAPTD